MIEKKNIMSNMNNESSQYLKKTIIKETAVI